MNLGAFSTVKPNSFATVAKLSLITFTHSEISFLFTSCIMVITSQISISQAPPPDIPLRLLYHTSSTISTLLYSDYELVKKSTSRLARSPQILGSGVSARLCAGCPLLPDIMSGFWGNGTNIVFVPAEMPLTTKMRVYRQSESRRTHIQRLCSYSLMPALTSCTRHEATRAPYPLTDRCKANLSAGSPRCSLCCTFCRRCTDPWSVPASQADERTAVLRR